jgi:hypothetical protein
MLQTYTVALTVRPPTVDYDPERVGRMAARFASYLPDGSQTLRINAAVEGEGGIAARVPAATAARALHAVATALELAAAEEPEGVEGLGDVSRAVVELDGPAD